MKKIQSTRQLFALYFIAVSHLAVADDTEIFIGTSAFAPDPKVMFLMDNSTSMTKTDGDSQSRMSEAKEILLDIVHNPDNSELDIGVAALSNNLHGGKIIAAIDNLDTTSRGSEPTYNPSSHGSCSPTQSNTLTQKICDIQATGHTQLEETYWETYLYYMGLLPEFGDISDTYITTDSAAKSGTTYYSPIFEDATLLTDISGDGNKVIADDLSCQTNYIVLMTDGEPHNDNEANSYIQALSGKSCSGHGKCMNELAEYMFTNDLDGDSSNDKQNIVTYTVGFHITSGSTEDNLLTEMAEDGGGQAFLADNASDLNNSLNAIFSNINNSATSFTSPGTANSTSNDARSLDYVYNTALLPASTPRWSGNLKKYRLDMAVTGQDIHGNDILELKVVDKNGKIVYDNSGNIISTANGGAYDVTSIWSNTADTDQVESGGSGAAITSYSARTVYTNSDTDNNPDTQDIFTKFNTSNTNLSYSMFNAVDDTEKDSLINWALGKDGDTTNTRWVMGDALHSKPLVINYGNRVSDYPGIFSDIRIVLGTNAGVLHLFTDDLGGSGNTTLNGHTDGDSVSEAWAFMPNELLPNIKTLQANTAGSYHPYGLDGSVALFIDDKNQDGNICAQTKDCNGDGNYDGDLNGDGDVADDGEDDDQVIIVFGMRRGGAYYYAIDVTDPDVPVFLWKFTDNAIQQSWSQAQFGKVKYFDGTNIQTKTVAIFSAGYDTNKDAQQTVGSNDSNGKGLFMVDLYTGELIWSILANGTASETALIEPGLTDSIPASPKAIDIDDDGILDRIYLADTGGNVWRIDLFNLDVSTAYDTNPDPSFNTRSPLNLGLYSHDSRLQWSIFKFANLGRGEVSDLANDRRFFNQIDFVQTRDSNGNFDAILLGSGHRNNPNETNTTNRFYMLRDPNVISYKFPTTAQPCITTYSSGSPDEKYDPKCKTVPTTLTNSSLDDVTNTALSNYSTSGWRLDLDVSGEKNLGSSVTINGTVFFTTFAPTINLNSPCTPQGGTSYIFSLNLHSAKAFVDFNNNGTIESTTDRKKTMPQTGGGIPETPPVIIPEGGDDIYIVPGSDPIWAGSASTDVFYWFKKSE